ncbi:AAA family ATPase [Vibrio methylphosphonaticus]|uniref:AAA family ATPase n=1 Tax=Vibrio methylphosphonaticus TaxID=2946866 RepID=UPI00202A7F60|nr:AAA family ATPase [Vibrio methylphosphonaticus]MCL9776845.1 AAA family ATPase [Vibrio methylphosphonaticus]
MKKVIIVNGIPASGKSTVASKIAKHFGWPYLSIDTIKEPFMGLHVDIDREFNRALGKAAYKVIWDTVASAPDDCVYVIDAWFGFQSKELLESYVRQSDVVEIIEVWNSISPELVADRYRSRLSIRKEGHPGEEYIPELMTLAERASPMNIGEVYYVYQDTGGDVQGVLTSLAGRPRALQESSLVGMPLTR